MFSTWMMTSRMLFINYFEREVFVMKNMFEKDHFRFLFLALVLVSVAMLVPVMHVSAAQTEHHFAVHYWGLGNDPISQERVYDVSITGESPVYIFAYHYSGENSVLGYSYYAISESSFTVSSDSPRINFPSVFKFRKNGDEYVDKVGATGEILFYYCGLDSGIGGKAFDNYVSMEFDSFNSSSDQLLFLMCVNDYLNGDYTGWDFSHSDTNLEYSKELGALAGLKPYRLHVERPPVEGNPVQNLYEVDTAFRFTFNSRSTTGFNLKNRNSSGRIEGEDISSGITVPAPPSLVVRVWTRVCYYKSENDELWLESSDVDVGSFDPSDLEIQFTLKDYRDMVNAQLSDEYILDEFYRVTHRIYRSDTIYFQLVDKSLGIGDILRVKNWYSLSIAEKDTVATVIDLDGNPIPDSDGGYSTGLETGSGIAGTDGDFDSAFDNAVNGGGWDSGSASVSVDTAIGITKDILGMVGKIPLALSKLFSFLPPWCLKYLGLSFVALGILIIYKLIRG